MTTVLFVLVIQSAENQLFISLKNPCNRDKTSGNLADPDLQFGVLSVNQRGNEFAIETSR